ncbi:hypothetical protein SCAR479_10897 [Seiridium cardinale]|uniref:Secreted protein n=1 Tax=Seiridium cardinale TaxID=138064 RepID=A0ABR2XF84_9PEZI
MLLIRTITVLLALVAEVVVSQVPALPNRNETTAPPTHIALTPHTTSTSREPIAIEALSTSLIPDTEGRESVLSRSQAAVHKIALREGNGSTVGSPKTPYRKPLLPKIGGLRGVGGGFRGEGGIVPIYDPLYGSTPHGSGPRRSRLYKEGYRQGYGDGCHNFRYSPTRFEREYRIGYTKGRGAGIRGCRPINDNHQDGQDWWSSQAAPFGGALNELPHVVFSLLLALIMF